MTESNMRPEDRFPQDETEAVTGPLGLEYDGSFWQNLRWFLARGVALLGAFVLMGAVFTGFAGWYTSRPEFCRSCHIMEPYYVSWQESTHKDVTCIKCHFPPGVGEKARGKVLGLVQLAKYVTSTQGPRPAAEIPDASCLRSGCHETRLLAGRLDFQGIPFDHGPHLEQLQRGKQLRCTSCHSQIVQGSHMTVTTSTCFLCHFKDEHFNEGLGTCTRCHQIPDKDFDLGGGAKFNHELAYERGVSCVNCHQDLIRGNGAVPRERCSVCHNREDDLKKIDDHVFMHQKHVTDHKVDCLNCHMPILHSLDPNLLQNSASNCASCHPGHHTEQVNMLEGLGAKTIPSQASGMTVHRIACGSCHKAKEVSPTGTVVWKASRNSCLICHESDVVDWLDSYHTTLRTSLDEIQATMDRVREALSTADLEAEKKARVESLLSDMEHDLIFLRVGNGIHNIHYATTLTQVLVDKLKTMCQGLELPSPEITLPEPYKPAGGDSEAADVTESQQPTEAAPDTSEPAPTEPAATEPAPTEPAPTEPAATEPAATEPAATEPAATEPAPTEPAPTEPAPTEPAPTASTEPAPETPESPVPEATESES